MNDVYLWAFFGVLAILFIPISIVYIKRGNANNSCELDTPQQKTLQRNIDKFRIKNKGSSLDEDEVYLVDYDNLGF